MGMGMGMCAGARARVCVYVCEFVLKVQATPRYQQLYNTCTLAS